MFKRQKLADGFQRNIFKDGKDGLGSRVVCDLLLIGGVVTELHLGVSIIHFGEGHDTSLQYSCLENPMNGGAW